jgi:hypothetical protein
MIAFESFIDLGGRIDDQTIRNRIKQKMIAIIRATKFQTSVGSAICLKRKNSFLAEKTSFFSFSIGNIQIGGFT